VELSGKAKSTISEHLKKLYDEGIIDSRPDPEDARKKIFSIKSEYLGELSREKLFKEDLKQYVQTYLESDGRKASSRTATSAALSSCPARASG